MQRCDRALHNIACLLKDHLVAIWPVGKNSLFIGIDDAVLFARLGHFTSRCCNRISECSREKSFVASHDSSKLKHV